MLKLLTNLKFLTPDSVGQRGSNDSATVDFELRSSRSFKNYTSSRYNNALKKPTVDVRNPSDLDMAGCIRVVAQYHIEFTMMTWTLSRQAICVCPRDGISIKTFSLTLRSCPDLNEWSDEFLERVSHQPLIIHIQSKSGSAE
jgi:hypothetical protein